jgi:hypothetical protein
VDSADPPPRLPPPPPAAYVYAATDERPRTPEERALCAKASEPDWVYLGTSVVLFAGAVALDTVERPSAGSEGIRYFGPAAVGLTWGFTLGGSYLALPKCSDDYVSARPPEGDVRTDWLVAVAFTALAGLTAPVVEGIETGTIPQAWGNTERIMRLVTASGFGIAGSLLPYLLPPKTWRAAKELEHLRASPSADGRGGFVSWSVRF